jgi:hypothetical protein
MLRFFGAIVLAIVAALVAYAQVKPYPIGPGRRPASRLRDTGDRTPGCDFKWAHCWS